MYTTVIKEQKEYEIIEPAPGCAINTTPHRTMRAVCDGSVRAALDVQDKCLNPGSPHYNKLWDVLFRERLFLIVLLNG